MSFFKNTLTALHKKEINLIEKIRPGYSKYIVEMILKEYEKKMNTYLTIRTTPKRSEQFYYSELNSRIQDELAIIIQGGLYAKDNFTVETCKVYRKSFKNAKIIVSTWENEDTEIINELKELGVFVIQSKKPKFTGIGNINLQVKSTYEGLKYAKKIKAKYVLKTRTDQRLQKNNLYEYFISLLEKFPVVKDGVLKLPQTQRIIVLQSPVAASMFMPLHVSDFLYFGRIEDVTRIFEIDEEKISETKEERFEREKKLINENSAMEFHHLEAPEVKLMETYILNYQKDLKPEELLSVYNFWNLLKEDLLVVSYNDVGFLWGKDGRYYNENELLHNYDLGDSDLTRKKYVLDFSNWLSIYCGVLEYSKEYEKIPMLPACDIIM